MFYALWIPDLFMQRVESDGEWSLMCPNECPGLADAWGEEFEALYTKSVQKRILLNSVNFRIISWLFSQNL